MLVLSRKLGQELVLDGRIRVFVLGMRSGSVRLGIEAPTDVSIVRPMRELVGALLPHAEAESEAPNDVAIVRPMRDLMGARHPQPEIESKANVVRTLPKRPR